jgi:hypothetical protein
MLVIYAIGSVMKETDLGSTAEEEGRAGNCRLPLFGSSSLPYSLLLRMSRELSRSTAKLIFQMKYLYWILTGPSFCSASFWTCLFLTVVSENCYYVTFLDCTMQSACVRKGKSSSHPFELHSCIY